MKDKDTHLLEEAYTQLNEDQNEFNQSTEWMNQIMADVHVGIKHDPENVKKNLEDLAVRVKYLVQSVEKFIAKQQEKDPGHEMDGKEIMYAGTHGRPDR